MNLVNSKEDVKYLKDSDLNFFEELHKDLDDLLVNNQASIFKTLLEQEDYFLGRLLTEFIDKTQRVEVGIRLALDQKDIYLSSILLRVLIEHIVTIYYIWIKCNMPAKENQLVAAQYLIVYRIGERVKRFGYEMKVKGIKKNEKHKKTVEEYIKNIPGGQIKDVETLLRHSNQFDIVRIGKFLYQDFPDDEKLKEFHGIILDFLIRYSELSSYVHGGPAAGEVLFNIENKFDLETELNEVKFERVILLTILKRLVLIYYTQITKKSDLIEVYASRYAELHERYLEKRGNDR